MWSVLPDDLWAGIEGGIGVAGATYLAQSPAIQKAVKELFAAASCQSVSTEGDLEFPAEAAYLLAKKR